MVLIAASFALDLNWLLMILGLGVAAGSAALFLKCKAWELQEK
jgi:hypothetical protein